MIDIFENSAWGEVKNDVAFILFFFFPPEDGKWFSAWLKKRPCLITVSFFSLKSHRDKFESKKRRKKMTISLDMNAFWIFFFLARGAYKTYPARIRVAPKV